jgi:DNA-binding MarR family transcriptional regulator
MLVPSNQLRRETPVADVANHTDQTDSTEAIGRELGTLIRGAKELHHVLSDRGQPVVDPPAFMLLSRLAEYGPMRLSALAGCVLLDVSTVSRQVQDLQQAGWVVRERDPQDGRASLLRLSPDGEAILAAGYEQRRRALRQVFVAWTDDQRQALADQLSRLNEAIAAFRTAAHLSTDLRQENAS